jgi:serine/threonine protein kinase
MALSVETKLGPYEIVGALSAGCIGDVYRARDTRLQRDVAIKVLPDLFASDPERLARFEREAQMLASLNHPHIAAIYGLEESGGVPALVLELVDVRRSRNAPKALSEAAHLRFFDGLRLRSWTTPLGRRARSK